MLICLVVGISDGDTLTALCKLKIFMRPDFRNRPEGSASRRYVGRSLVGLENAYAMGGCVPRRDVAAPRIWESRTAGNTSGTGCSFRFAACSLIGQMRSFVSCSNWSVGRHIHPGADARASAAMVVPSAIADGHSYISFILSLPWSILRND